jgi:hypothetical protein
VLSCSFDPVCRREKRFVAAVIENLPQARLVFDQFHGKHFGKRDISVVSASCIGPMRGPEDSAATAT